jgi:hypothetical protein
MEHTDPIKLMAAILLTAVALLTYGPARSGPDPYATVRPVEHQLFRMCSAVVIAPGKALSAAHCVMEGEATHVEGQPIVGAVFDPEGRDLVVLEVPGLHCPCATIDRAVPAANDQVRVIGFPGGKKEDLGVTVRGVGDASVVIPDSGVWEMRMIWTSPGIRPGHSGGGMFAFRDGEWKLVGINVIMLAQWGMFLIAGGSEPLDRTPILP